MNDVARAAGVSQKTVSRVLNNEPHVQDAVRDKVRRAAHALGYVPSASARALRSKRSYALHLVIHNNQSTYIHAIQAGALQACQKEGYQLAVTLVDEGRLNDDGFIMQAFDKLLARARPDGIILVAPLTNHPGAEEVLARRGVPAVRIGPNDFEGKSGLTLKVDEQRAAHELTLRLVAQGHRRIGFVRGREDQNASHERFAGFASAMKTAGLALEPRLILPGDFQFEGGFAAGQRLLSDANPPSAVFASNDDMASGVLAAAHQMKIEVPEDLSIVGFDDADFASKLWPALTTVQQPLLQLGEDAGRALLTRKDSDQWCGEAKILPHHIVERGSTAPSRTTQSYLPSKDLIR
jgi:LacI family transcriptional regulator